MQPLFDAIRRACSPRAWSRGVELARGDAVVGEREEEHEIALRVVTRGGLISPRVSLYPEDAEWECECASSEDACEHVAAAVIALRQARKQGASLPSAERAPGHLRYCLGRHGRRLALEREIVTGERAHRLETTLDAIASGRVAGPRFSATQADLAVERALGPRLRGPLPPGIVSRVLEALSRCEDVRLDGAPVHVSREPVGPRAHVEDAPGGFRLRVAPDPGVGEVFDGGAALCGDTLRPLAEAALTGREREELPQGRLVPFDEVARFVSETLPELRERFPVEIHTRATSEDAPRVLLEVEREGARLSVLPTLVYGDPPRARVDAGRLVPLRDGPIPMRDADAERAHTRRLQQELDLLPGHRVLLEAEEAVELSSRLDRWSGEIRGRAHEQFTLAPALEPRIEAQAERFEVAFESPADPDAAVAAGRQPRRVAGEAVLRAWREGRALVPLTGGGFAPLPADWLARLGDRVADLLAARGDGHTLPRSALPDLARLCEALDRPRPAALAGLEPLLEGFEGIPRAPLPPDLRAALRPYQQRGVDFLCFLRDAGLGALLADDMGLGKTLQALCALRGRSLVVAPTSVLHGWVEEIRRFRPSLRVAVYHGPTRKLDPEADVTLTSYALLRLDLENLRRAPGGEVWDCAVLDEAQAIKNPEAQVARAAFALEARFRIALTGTPVENRLEELWSQLHFLNPGLLGAREDFVAGTARPIGEGRPEAAARLRERIRPFVLRRLKRDVAPELPPRTEVVLHCELEEPERAVYDAVRAASVEAAVASLRAGGGVMQALEALLRLRQAACHPALGPGPRAERSSKLDLLLDRLEQVAAEGHKALVFSQWTSLLDLIEPWLGKASLPFARLDGATRDRAAVVRAFQAETGPPVMLVSLRAGGFGLNLTAADHVFLLDPWWNPAVEDQAADRTHRIGQTRAVVVHRLVARDTVEERILALQERKRELADLALGEAEQARALTREDLLALLQEDGS
jgi:superfamily II DNA or RNA helicase